MRDECFCTRALDQGASIGQCLCGSLLAANLYYSSKNKAAQDEIRAREEALQKTIAPSPEAVTTTTAELIKLSFNGWVVDTPGIRQFDLWNVISAELDGHFPEFRPFVAACGYAGCSHLRDHKQFMHS